MQLMRIYSVYGLIVQVSWSASWILSGLRDPEPRVWPTEVPQRIVEDSDANAEDTVGFTSLKKDGKSTYIMLEVVGRNTRLLAEQL